VGLVVYVLSGSHAQTLSDSDMALLTAATKPGVAGDGPQSSGDCEVL
jgi:hypothetical protein